MRGFTDAVCIVTGGASGLGRALCAEFLQRGAACVVIADRNATAAERTAAELGPRARAATADVTEPEALAQLVESVVRDNGRLDYLVNNAGILIIGEMRDLTPAHWRSVVDVNLLGTVHGTLAALPVFLQQGHGHIVNVASGYGFVPGPMLAPYVATKHAVVGLSETLRVELAGTGVHVTVVCPGYIQTPMLEQSDGLHIEIRAAMGTVPFKPITAERAAKLALNGVARRRRFVLFPGYVRVLIWIYRNLRWLADALGRKTLRDLRGVRSTCETAAAAAPAETLEPAAR